jgi:hypothetical protein
MHADLNCQAVFAARGTEGMDTAACDERRHANIIKSKWEHWQQQKLCVTCD